MKGMKNNHRKGDLNNNEELSWYRVHYDLNAELELALVAIHKCLNLLKNDDLYPDSKILWPIDQSTKPHV